MNRLDALYDLIQPGLPLWDIGCDHGILGLRALRESKVPFAHFVDESPVVAKRLLTSVPREKSKVWNRSGEDLPWETVEGTVVIAGLGAPTIAKIVGAIPSNRRAGVRLVLSAEKNSDDLRCALDEGGWRLVSSSERLCREGPRFRTVFAAEYGRGERIHPFGNAIFEGAEGREYLEQLLQFWSSSRIKQSHSPSRFERLRELDKSGGNIK